MKHSFKIKNLLSEGSTNSKTAKNELKTFILYLAPHLSNGKHNLCPFASEGCIKSCLNTAGRGAFSNVQLSRLAKTNFWGFDRENFYLQLSKELIKISNKYKNEKVAIRLNGTSDVDHLYLLNKYTGVDFLSFENLLFYDYTKNPNHVKRYMNSNYKLTFSRSECNNDKAIEILKNGGNVAVVFKNSLPKEWNGYKVINGDETDLRYFDPKNVVIGLVAKGKAKKDASGFVVNN